MPCHGHWNAPLNLSVIYIYIGMERQQTERETGRQAGRQGERETDRQRGHGPGPRLKDTMVVLDNHDDPGGISVRKRG